MRHHRGDPALLLSGCLLMDVSRGSPALSHACGGLWEWILTEKILLCVRVPLPCHRGWRVCSYWLQELRDRESVSAALQTHSWNCRADMLDDPLCKLTYCVYVWPILKRNQLIISASTLCASLETRPKHLRVFVFFLPGMGSCSIFYVIWKWLTGPTLWFHRRVLIH